MLQLTAAKTDALTFKQIKRVTLSITPPLKPFRLQVEMSVLSLGAEPVTCQADLLLIRHCLPRDEPGQSSPGFTSVHPGPFCSGPSLSVPAPSACCCKHQGFTRALTWTASAILFPRPPHPAPTSDLPQCCVVHRAQQGTLRLQCVVGWGVCQ